MTPGYYKQPDLTAQMFDEEGFYKIGDAGRFVDPDDPSQGLVFDGRVVEDFKLMSGTFVLVGTLRTHGDRRRLAGAAGRRGVRPGPRLCRPAGLPQRRRLPAASRATRRAALARGAAGPSGRGRDASRGLARMNAECKGSSMQVERVLLMAEPPSVDGHEITDKGYINQRATLERRKALVDKLYAGGEGVIEID